ncbi:hypothetical protein B0H21DRAFT_741243 [Amylocystis lapponica]|nr:hypothetical protein B0H21DRAFT_741243 [Amylocystis lapponica]
MSTTFLSAALATLLFATAAVRAESHTITFNNQCGSGTPQLIINGQVVSNGTAYTQSSPISGIAYLQTGKCLFNGEGCVLMEMTLGNAVVEGGGSSSDISLIPPHAYNVQTSFAYYGVPSCNNQGADCNDPTCSTAFFKPDDNQVQVSCQQDNVNLVIGFCTDATKMDLSSWGSSSEPSSSAAPISSSASAISPSVSPASSKPVAVAQPSSSLSVVDPVSSPSVFSPAPVSVPSSSAVPISSSGASSPVVNPSSSAPASRASCRPRPSSSASVGSPSTVPIAPSSAPVAPSSSLAASSIPVASPSASVSSFSPASPPSSSAAPSFSAVPSSPAAPSSSIPASIPAASSSFAPAAPSASPSACGANQRRSVHTSREAAPFPEGLKAVFESRRRGHARGTHRRGSPL